MRNRHVLLFVYAVLNVWAYASLLPIWEGFDEPFHFGYVEYLRTHRDFPVLGRTTLPGAVWESMLVAPASHVVRANIPELRTYREYHALPDADRRALRSKLLSVRSLPDDRPSERLNYEAHHAPLAYVACGIVDYLLAGATLCTRVLVLRMFCGLIAVVLYAVYLPAVVRRLGLPEVYGDVALFTVFSWQMFYATADRVANDGLAVGLFPALLAEALCFLAGGTRRSAVRLGLIFGAGLLTKAYYLALCPFLAGVVAMAVWRDRHAMWKACMVLGLAAAVAAPWYLRNVVLYGNVPGMQESMNGVGWREALAAAGVLRWPEALAYVLRGAVWTGNSSFVTFSRVTIDGLLLLLGVGSCAFLFGRRRGVLVMAGASYGAGILYITAVSSAFTKGQSAGASPWYMQPLVVIGLMMFYVGCSRWGRVGRWLVRVQAAVCGYVFCAGYVAKLVPLYSGYGQARGTVGLLWDWYLHDPRRTELLRATALGPVEGVYWGIWAVVGCCCVLLARWWLAGSGSDASFEVSEDA